MSVTAPAAPALSAALESLTRQLKMPYARALAAELIATAKSQLWDPAEVIKALMASGGYFCWPPMGNSDWPMTCGRRP